MQSLMTLFSHRPTCSQFSNLKNCNGQATVKLDGTCPNDKPCNTNGYKGARCDECFTDTHNLIEDGTVSRITACTDLNDPATCNSPTSVPLITCELKGSSAICDLGERALDGECELCEANTYADGTRTDGSNDGGIRVQCKPCPAGTITQQLGSTSINDCVAACGPGEFSLDAVCTPCGNSKFADGTDTSGTSDDNRRTACKICPAGSSNQLETSPTINECKCANDADTGSYFYISEEQQSCVQCPSGELSVEGATSLAECFAKFQKVSDQRFCYGVGSDSRATQAAANVDEFVFAFSRVGADDDDETAAALCAEASKMIPNATFVPTAELACTSGSSDGDVCAAAFDIAVRGGGSIATFCHPLFETRIGDTFGYPQLMCREHECNEAGGACWPPNERGATLYPYGCVHNKDDNTVLYYSKKDATLYYNGFEYDVVCERYVCPPNPDNDFERPDPLNAADFEAGEDASKVPTCRLSVRGANAKSDEATALNNKTFIPIAIVLSFICMFIAGCITQDDLKWNWIVFGVGLRTFDMQTDWGFYAISLRNEGFQSTAVYGDETAIDFDPAELLTIDDVVTMRRTCLAFCIIGTLLTPFDIVGNLARSESMQSSHANEFAMVISILILAFEDLPQLYLNIKFIGIMGAGDPISVLSLIASIINIAYNVIVLLYDFGRNLDF